MNKYEEVFIFTAFILCIVLGFILGWSVCTTSWKTSLIDNPADIATITSIEKLKRQAQELERSR